jgi:hypothetical protein
MNKSTTEEFVAIATEKHGAKYDYSKSVYTTSRDKLIVVCPEHGEFLVRASSHTGGSGCPRCPRKKKPCEEHGLDSVIDESISDDARIKQELANKKFITRATMVHGDNYDYFKSVYKSMTSKLIIICRKHGEFLQSPQSHLKYRGCPKCGFLKKSEKLIGTKLDRKLIRMDRIRVRNATEQFIESAKIVHGDKYDYSKTLYVHSKTKVVIVCKEHGEFHQTPNGHLRGKGCRACGLHRSHAVSLPILINYTIARRCKEKTC